MIRAISRAILLALAGALAGAAGLAACYARQPAFALEMDRDLPALVTGVSPVERHKDETFAWTSARASVSLPGLDRRTEWRCTVRVRGARPPELPQPTVTVAIDGIALSTRVVTNDYQDVEVTAPVTASPGLALTIASTPTFVPGPSDRRELGVQLDRLECRPGGDAWALPPRRAIGAAAVSAGAFGATLGVVGLPMAGAAGATLLVAGVQAIPFAADAAPYSRYADTIARTAVWTALAVAALVVLLGRLRRQPLSTAAMWAVAISAGALLVELQALLHPSKTIIDAVFHAHRLQSVLAGDYYFTQPMPSGVRFPYAIALYVVSAPWTLLTRDYVSLLRVVVSVSRALAGLLLYPMVVRAWKDRAAGVAAVALFHLVPLPFVVIGNANLTYAFGQSAAVMTFAAAAALPLESRRVWQTIGLAALASLAFLSHVGIFPLVLVLLVVTSGSCWWFGRSSAVAQDTARSYGVAARVVLVAAIAAAVVSVVSYYAHFTDAYRTLAHVRAGAAAAAPATAGGEGATASGGAETGDAAAPTPLVDRVASGVQLGLAAFGWPITILAGIGAWSAWRAGARDRLGLVIGATALTCGAFVALSVVAPVEPRFWRYTAEFISRVYYVAMPVVVVLGARGALDAWRGGLVTRAVAAVLWIGALATGATSWLAWLR